MTHNKVMRELRRDLRNWRRHRRTARSYERAKADKEIARITELIETHRHHPGDVMT